MVRGLNLFPEENAAFIAIKSAANCNVARVGQDGEAGQVSGAARMLEKEAARFANGNIDEAGVGRQTLTPTLLKEFAKSVILLVKAIPDPTARRTESGL